MDKILIVCKSEAVFEGLSHCICPCRRAVHAKSGAAARRQLCHSRFTLVVIYTPLPDEHGKELWEYTAEKTYSGIILLCDPDICNHLQEQMNMPGMAVMPKNAPALTIKKTAEDIMDTARSMQTADRAGSRIQHRSEEIRMANTAKKYLIKYMGLTEPCAHRYIEKQAMDKRRSRKDIVKEILQKYDS